MNTAKKILVVDDDQGILDAFEAILDSMGYYVITDPNGDYVQNLLKNDLPDLILLDVLLSGKDGRDICRELKSNKDTQNIPIIMISAHPGAHSSIQDVGADDYLAKPFEVEDLLERVKKYTR